MVIYEENHSFDNLYGSWGPVNGEPVTGLADARQINTTQITQDGDAYGCLLQNDVNLSAPTPVATTCVDRAHQVPASGFADNPFTIDDYIGPADKTCAPEGTSAPENGVVRDSAGAVPGGCTRDLVHRFYQEQYQLNGGRQNRYVTGSDAVGLTMGVYDTTKLLLYRYLHRRGAPNYVVADHFFQAAFGGSFLNHQYLVAARAPIDTTAAGAHAGLHSVVDANGVPASDPLYTATGTVKDSRLTQACPPAAVTALACGDYAVNTIQPASLPTAGGDQLPLIDDTQYPNIGDRLSAAAISWNWYSGGWTAAADHPGPLFQSHHQPLNYYAGYAPGQPGRSHLRDETDFITAAKKGRLPTVSFVKPYGAENEHPGYASEPDGSDHLVDLIKAITSGPQARDTLIVVTYDEFGGQWDHVAPPGQGNTDGPSDQFGPGTRIPALLISTGFQTSGVDHTNYETTSILAALEHALDLPALATRDAQVNDLTNAIRTGTATDPGRGRIHRPTGAGRGSRPTVPGPEKTAETTRPPGVTPGWSPDHGVDCGGERAGDRWPAGAGKSTVADLLADRLGAALLSSDHVRKEMAGMSPLIPAGGAYRRRHSRQRAHRSHPRRIDPSDPGFDRGECLHGAGRTAVTTKDNRLRVPIGGTA